MPKIRRSRHAGRGCVCPDESPTHTVHSSAAHLTHDVPCKFCYQSVCPERHHDCLRRIPAPWGISVRQQRNNLFNALLFTKHPVLYQRLIQAAPPWHYYVNTAALASAAIGWASGRTWLLGPAGAIWTVGVMRFARYRLRNTSRNPLHLLEMVATSALVPPAAVFLRLKGALKYRVVFF